MDKETHCTEESVDCKKKTSQESKAEKMRLRKVCSNECVVLMNKIILSRRESPNSPWVVCLHSRHETSFYAS